MKNPKNYSKIHLSFLIIISINSFFLLRKDIYPYECIDKNWLIKINENSLPEKEDFHRNLNMENVIDSDYNHSIRICDNLEIKNLGEYYNVYLKSNTL